MSREPWASASKRRAAIIDVSGYDLFMASLDVRRRGVLASVARAFERLTRWLYDRAAWTLPLRKLSERLYLRYVVR